MSGDLALTVYEPGRIQLSTSSIFERFWRIRRLAWRLMLRDFTARYRQSILGYTWSIFPALAMTAIFTFLGRGKILALGATTLPYPVFALLGLTAWWLFANSFQTVTISLTASATLIGKMKFPREALLAAALGHPLFETGIRILLIIVVAFLTRASFAWTIVLAPLVLIPLVLLAVGVGAILAILNALVRDVSSMLYVVLPMALFLTPALYPTPTTFPAILINYLNPVSPFVVAIHDLAEHGTLTMPWALLGASLFALMVFLVGVRVFIVAQPVIAERL
jgi:lipopolysaccharide transport system permease protein